MYLFPFDGGLTRLMKSRAHFSNVSMKTCGLSGISSDGTGLPIPCQLSQLLTYLLETLKRYGQLAELEIEIASQLVMVCSPSPMNIFNATALRVAKKRRSLCVSLVYP